MLHWGIWSGSKTGYIKYPSKVNKEDGATQFLGTRTPNTTCICGPIQEVRLHKYKEKGDRRDLLNKVTQNSVLMT